MCKAYSTLLHPICVCSTHIPVNRARACVSRCDSCQGNNSCVTHSGYSFFVVVMSKFPMRSSMVCLVFLSSLVDRRTRSEYSGIYSYKPWRLTSSICHRRMVSNKMTTSCTRSQLRCCCCFPLIFVRCRLVLAAAIRMRTTPIESIRQEKNNHFAERNGMERMREINDDK